MATRGRTVDTTTESVVGEDFDDFLAGFEARLDPAGRAMYDAFAAQYDLASAVIALRKRQRLTQVDLAQRAHVHQSDISRLERGGSNISQSALQRIAAALGARLALVPEHRPTRPAH